MVKGEGTMKRIMNDVAIQTICYTIGGNQKIRIIDYPGTYQLSKGIDGAIQYDGFVKNLYSYKYDKYSRAKVHEITLDGDTIVFSVVTRFEEY